MEIGKYYKLGIYFAEGEPDYQHTTEQRISPPSLSLCASGTASSRDDSHLWLQLWVENFPVRSASHQVY